MSSAVDEPGDNTVQAISRHLADAYAYTQKALEPSNTSYWATDVGKAQQAIREAQDLLWKLGHETGSLTDEPF